MNREFTIFYTDDDPDDVDFFKEAAMSIESSFKIFTQKSGMVLLKLLESTSIKPDILFLDLNMPGITGFEVLQKIRNSKNYKTLPVIIFSTSNDKKTIEKSFDLGASFYITKPNDFVSLKNSIAYTMNINWDTFIPKKDNFVYSN